MAGLASLTGKANSLVGRGGAKLNDLTGGLTKGIKSWTDPISELMGVKGELYTIGYIAAEWQESSPMLQNGLVGGMIKAYQNAASQVNSLLGAAGLDSDITKFGLPVQNATTVDGFFRFEGNMDVQLPSYPIQFQTNINMQRIRNPDVVSAEIFISSRMSDDIVEKTSRILSDNNLISLATGTDGDQARVRRKINELRWLQNNGRPFTYYTPHCVYENMVLKSIKPKNDEQTMDGFSAVLTFQEVIYYTNVYDSTSRRSKKALSAAGQGIVTNAKQILLGR